MIPPRNATEALKLTLWLVAIHSLGVGIFLVVAPDAWLQPFGFPMPTDRFFRAQGGVFHFVVVAAYILAVGELWRSDALVRLAILTKGIAVFFLGAYVLFVYPIWGVAFACLGDAGMGILLFLLLRAHRRGTST